MDIDRYDIDTMWPPPVISWLKKTQQLVRYKYHKL